jgi:beta-lactamase superfamily II metal-dependent hydrolase
MFFPGDAEKVRLKALASVSLPKIDLLKTPHHGRSSSAASDFIQRIAAPIAIVNASSAEAKIQKVLEKTGAAVYYTVGSDHSFTSDGETLTYTGP